MYIVTGRDATFTLQESIHVYSYRGETQLSLSRRVYMYIVTGERRNFHSPGEYTCII